MNKLYLIHSLCSLFLWFSRVSGGNYMHVAHVCVEFLIPELTHVLLLLLKLKCIAPVFSKAALQNRGSMEPMHGIPSGSATVSYVHKNTLLGCSFAPPLNPPLQLRHAQTFFCYYSLFYYFQWPYQQVTHRSYS